MLTQQLSAKQDLTADYNWVYDNLVCEYDPANRVMQFNMNTHPHPSFTPALMHDISSFQKSVMEICETHKSEGSLRRSIFWFWVLPCLACTAWGDLGFF